MYWKDEGYLLSKNNISENSIIIEAFTLNHGKCSGIVYGGSSKKLKKNFQIGNKILLNWRSKSEHKIGYFNTELIKPISPLFFDDKKRSVCVLAATSILKILLPERQINKKIFYSFEKLLNNLNDSRWINLYILWELSLIKELGFEIDFLKKGNHLNETKKSIEINNKYFRIPSLLTEKKMLKVTKFQIREALEFNRSLIMENFIIPNQLRFPLSRNLLEKYYN